MIDDYALDYYDLLKKADVPGMKNDGIEIFGD